MARITAAQEQEARERLAVGLSEISKKQTAVNLREDYIRGEHALPFAPEGVNAEYMDLREQSVANWIGIAHGAPIQRMRVDSFRTAKGDEADEAIWNGVWQANKMDSRQALIYSSMMLHGRGVASVWPNKADKKRPIVRPEDFGSIHVEMDPDDPFTPLWVVKTFELTSPLTLPSGFVLPGNTTTTRSVAIVYDAKTITRFEKGGVGEYGNWEIVFFGRHPMRRPPFALYDYKPDSKGRPWSAIDSLIPAQNAINTIRFNMLLAMQFSAYRQRIVTGFDPRATDKDGNFLYKRDPNTGEPVVDANGNAVPILNNPGRVGVDRLLAFPGGETKVFDLPESNLANYVTMHKEFVVNFFAIAQIPPQYLLSQMSNISGDALAGAESTLASLVQELELAAGEGNEDLAELGWYAMGNSDDFSTTSETVWADAEARSFAQIVDAVVKLVSIDFPKQAAFEMIPGATKQKVDRWMEMAEEESYSNRLLAASRSFQQPLELTQVDTDGAPADGG
ncbi:phage portal protein [Herbiconiux solani]|uniref:phage portal protein n=1 Tax=Herbiconiux solani TaxID=661329 RepID=UPI00082654E3|nr:phage portal protein [Herbiconiux solani]